MVISNVVNACGNSVLKTILKYPKFLFLTRSGTIKIVSDILPIYSSDGQSGLTFAACMISIPDQNAFVITGGIISP